MAFQPIYAGVQALREFLGPTGASCRRGALTACHVSRSARIREFPLPPPRACAASVSRGAGVPVVIVGGRGRLCKIGGSAGGRQNWREKFQIPEKAEGDIEQPVVVVRLPSLGQVGVRGA